MTRALWQRLFDEVAGLHSRMEHLDAFCPLPQAPRYKPVVPRHLAPADLMMAEHFTVSDQNRGLVEAIRAVSPIAYWRRNYEDTPIAEDFNNRFGCFCLVGTNAPFKSHAMSAFFIYMPAPMHYPWHHHPAEEAYVVLAGEADFHIVGKSSKTHVEGDVITHATNEAHSMTTFRSGILAYVVWRNDLGSPPMLTQGVPQVYP